MPASSRATAGSSSRGAAEGVERRHRRGSWPLDRRDALLDPATPDAIRLAADIGRDPTRHVGRRRRSVRSAAAQRVAGTDRRSPPAKRTWTITRSGSGPGSASRARAPTLRAGARRVERPGRAQGVEKAVLTKPTEARYLQTRAGTIFGVAASSAGRALDVDATGKDVMAALDARAGRPRQAEADQGQDDGGRARAHDGRGDEAGAARRARRHVDDVLPGRRPQRVRGQHHVPARRLDGVVVKPGQTFDFWGALGEVSFRTGYRWATRSSAATRSRAGPWPAASAPPRPRSSTPPRGAASRS